MNLGELRKVENFCLEQKKGYAEWPWNKEPVKFDTLEKDMDEWLREYLYAKTDLDHLKQKSPQKAGKNFNTDYSGN
jgi:hypothetical protein